MLNRLADRTGGISPFYVMALLRRAKELEAQGRDVIHMEIGEPDFPTPPTIIEAGIKNLRTGLIKYTPAAGLPELREKIAEYYWQCYRVKIAAERIFVTPGASGAFLLAFGVSLNPNEEIIMADPCYPCNRNFVALFDAKVKTIPVDASSNYQLTAKMINRNWSDACRGVLVASPANPSGTLMDDAALMSIIREVNAVGGCFYSDEIYHGLIYDCEAATALQFSDDVWVINSFSKYFGMTGWRVGWLIVPDPYVDAVEKLAQNIFIATSTHSQYAAMAAFEEETRVELEQRRSIFRERRDFLYRQLTQLGFTIPIKPQGAFYIYADCSQFTSDSFQFAQDLLEAEAVAVTPGKDFGSYRAQHYLRFAYTASIERMAEAVSRLEKFIQHR
jgi:aspartate/methionine/tyrosine aminotransferase